MVAVNLASDGVLAATAAAAAVALVGTAGVGATGDATSSFGRVVACTGEEFTGMGYLSDMGDGCGDDVASDGNNTGVGDAACVETGAVDREDDTCVDASALDRGDAACVEAGAVGSATFGDKDFPSSRPRIAK